MLKGREQERRRCFIYRSRTARTCVWFMWFVVVVHIHSIVHLDVCVINDDERVCAGHVRRRVSLPGQPSSPPPRFIGDAATIVSFYYMAICAFRQPPQPNQPLTIT